MKVLLLNQLTYSGKFRRTVAPSTLIGLGSMLLNQPKMGLNQLPEVEVAIDVCNLRKETPENHPKELIRKHFPDVLGLGVYEFNFLETISIIRQALNENPELLVVLGGPMATALPITVLEETRANAVLRGEADLTFREFVSRYAAHEMRTIPGLMRRKTNGEFISSFGGNSIPFLSAQDFRNMRFDLDLLKKTIETGGYTAISLLTARGCFFGSCSFCDQSRNWRRFSDNEVIEELDRLSAFGLQLRINDPSFGGPGNALPNLLDKMAGRFQNLSILLSADQLLGERAVGSRTVNLTLIEKLKRAGVKEILLGIESFSDGMLQRLKSGRYSAREAKETMLSLAREGFDLNPSLILADFRSNAREMMDTIEGMHDISEQLVQENLRLPNFSLQPFVIPSVGSKYYAEVCELAAKGELKIVGARSMDTGIPYYNLFPILSLHTECDMDAWFDMADQLSKEPGNAVSGYPHENLRLYEYLTRVILSHLNFTYDDGMKARAKSNA